MSASPTCEPYTPRHHVRIVTATSLFDGHDAAINIMRRLLQASGAEVIHLGHNRSAGEIVDCAIEEDAQGIAITSYQGGHVELLRYMVDLLRARQAQTRIFGGGGGTILPEEIAALHAYGVARIYTPDDGRQLGLQGMINDVLRGCDFATHLSDSHSDVAGISSQMSSAGMLVDALSPENPQAVARCITLAENVSAADIPSPIATLSRNRIANNTITTPVLGVTGTGGSGKSSLVDELVRRFLRALPEVTIAILSVDPTRRRTGGALLGDRIRMNAIDTPRVYMRSLATRQSNAALSRHLHEAIDVCRAAGFDLIIVETSGIGQSDSEITEHADATLYVMTADYGAATQLEKIDMLDFADVIAINKFDKPGSQDALRDIRRQVQRNRQAFGTAGDDLPVFGTIASVFNDAGVNRLFASLLRLLHAKTSAKSFAHPAPLPSTTGQECTIPRDRERYLAEIDAANTAYERFVAEQSQIASQLCQVQGTLRYLQKQLQEHEITGDDADADAQWSVRNLERVLRTLQDQLDPACQSLLRAWPAVQQRYRADTYTFHVRGQAVEQASFSTSLAGLRIPRVSLPNFADWGDLLRWLLRENAPGHFPFAAGVFPLKRQNEDPTRMFAGEGGPERTNRRFHYVSAGLTAKRLSTAFDSVTLYGEDPAERPDIFGKVGNSGVSVCTIDDAKKLYAGFNLCDPNTSVSMTINGPAPMILAFFLNAAIDQQCELYIRQQGQVQEIRDKIEHHFRACDSLRPVYQGEIPEASDGLGLMLLGLSGSDVLPRDVYEGIKANTLSAVRGTVQADILKEDQAQNTCIFSTAFALRMMGDIQEYFIDHRVRNFYSVSVSGYHIAEAGANPITQLAFTLANGFTFVEYYLSRGMHIDDFAPNLSFFFSNGLDPEYSVIGRVARRIWAKAIKNKYGGNERSQKLKYHIQTSGRSLHAQEIAFNDIRTTLQALYALADNCNSLHTNAYDEAITTPTEESVRRAIAIQLIIGKELGLSRNENPLQGSFFIAELTDLVEQAVMEEFRRLAERGGVLGAMERMYQRTKIQEESLEYEARKHSGALPVVGVNMFVDDHGSPTVVPQTVIRSTLEERRYAVDSCAAFKQRHASRAGPALAHLKDVALTRGNTFAALMEATQVATLGQLSGALYEVGGRYRRHM